MTTPSEPTGDLAKAEALFKSGRVTEARVTLEHALAVRPGDTQVRFALADCLNRLGEHVAAEAHARVLMAAGAENAWIWYQLGCALQGQGRFAEGSDAFLESLKRDNVADARQRMRDCDNPPGPTASRGATPSAAQNGGEPKKPSTVGESIDRRGVAERGDMVFSEHTLLRHLVLPPIAASIMTVAVVAGGFVPGLIGLVLSSALAAFTVFAWVVVLLQSRMNRYDFYEHRVDLHIGVARRRQVTIWYYEMISVGTVREAWDYLTDTSSLEVTYRPSGEDVVQRFDGLGSPSDVHKIYERLQDPRVRERRSIKHLTT